MSEWELTDDDYCTFCDAYHPNPIPDVSGPSWLRTKKCKRADCYREARHPHKYCCAPCRHNLQPHFHDRRCKVTEITAAIPDEVVNSTYHGSVWLMTFGVNNKGSDWLLNFFPRWNPRAHYDTWHQVQHLYKRRTTLRTWGHNVCAQNEFLEVHGAWADINVEKTLWLMTWYFKMRINRFAIPIACSAGHHRSCAHAQVTQQRAELRFPNVNVRCCHLDGLHASLPQQHNDPSRSLVSQLLDTEPFYVITEEVPHDFAELQRAYHATLQNPPPFLLHDLC